MRMVSRAPLLGCSIFALSLAIVPVIRAEAQSTQTGDREEETGSPQKVVYLAGLTDDPDPIPWDGIDPEHPGQNAGPFFRKNSVLGSLVIAGDMLSRSPLTAWAPCAEMRRGTVLAAGADRPRPDRAARPSSRRER